MSVVLKHIHFCVWLWGDFAALFLSFLMAIFKLIWAEPISHFESTIGEGPLLTNLLKPPLSFYVRAPVLTLEAPFISYL